ncbi:MAG: hypothetical protein CVV04_00570 [Firmicutes bacterium HGW-Firmicutes-9]|jgi:hypothetical protein|nr:MAG: hypothetical protein CVV04_00570 [Firmicutes bacterium HGW-Firmicutes-9]
MGKPRLAAEPILTAESRHQLAPSKRSTPLVRLGRALIPAYLKYALAFTGVEILSPDRILDELRDFQQKRSRLIVAFRHPYGDEPQLIFHVFENMLPRLARKAGSPLKHEPGLRLVHDYAVALWGDAFIRFLLPRAGAMPVYHVKCEAGSLSSIRAVLKDGPNPLGLAPEGQISYHSETLPRIEQGAVRMGFWCASDIERANRTEEVRILPISIHYQYDKRDHRKVVAHVCKLEQLCGLSQGANKIENTLAELLPRLVAVEHRLLAITESFYTATYNYQTPDAHPDESDAQNRQRRWNALLPAALSVAEHALGIDPSRETVVQRMYRVRLEGWARVKPEESLKGLSKLELALADRRTGEGWFAMQHMELVDLMSYHDVSYMENDTPPSDDRIVEHVLNLADLASRLMGGNITNRPNDIRKRAFIVPGDCVNLTALMPEYHAHPKHTAKVATEQLAKNLESCIERYHHETSR